MLDCIIDISHHQNSVDFAKMKTAGISAVIHKATQGTGGADSKFLKRQRICRELGLLFGSYHFGTSGDAAAQAKNYLQVSGTKKDELLVLDFEHNGANTMSLEQAEEFVRIVLKETGRYPVIYGGALLKEVNITSESVLANCPLWISHYTNKPKPSLPKGWSAWTLWQYTDGNAGSNKNYKKVYTDGAGYCDRNYFNGDESGLLKLFGREDVTAQAEAIEGKDVEAVQQALPGTAEQ